ncbi:MAG: hypothetical protein HW421_3946 [Ignavibacteria bacterium]|nr:hypothetical protein [Ignavibacteria bacterium]
MYATYTLTKEELTYEFLDNLKKMFNEGSLQITVENFDETDYLMRSPKNREYLLKSIQNVKEGKNLITVPIEEIERQISETDNI